MTAPQCPRCGTFAVEAHAFGEEPHHVGGCVCYPHPPLCIGCRRPLEADCCVDVHCAYFDWLQPEPIRDGLWESFVAGETYWIDLPEPLS